MLSEEDFLAQFEFGPLLAKGGFSLIHKAKRKSSQKDLIIKHDYKSWRANDIPKEIKNLLQLENKEGIIQMEDFYFPPHRPIWSYYIIFEAPSEQTCSLFDYISKNGPLTDKLCMHLLKQHLAIQKTVTDAGLLHGDLKADNLLIASPSMKLTLIDFNLSMPYHEADSYFTFDGTPMFAPPEWLRKSCFKAKNYIVWTAGILLFEMHTNSFPFENEKSILKGNLNWPSTAPVESRLRAIITRCLDPEPCTRLTLCQLHAECRLNEKYNI